MKKCFKILGYTVLSCISLLVLYFVLSWVHMQFRVDISFAIEDVARKLHISPDKLSIVNDPRRYCPVVICKCLEDRANVLDRCESVIPLEEDLKRLPESTKNEILCVWQREFSRVEKKTRREFEIYGISLCEPIKRIYYITEGKSNEPIVVETKDCVYVLCHINSM